MSKLTDKPGVRSSLKALTITVLLLILLIPLGMIRSLVGEREMRARGVADEIIQGAGGVLDIVGPLLVLPYEKDSTEKRDGEWVPVVQRGELSVLPESVDVRVTLDVDFRHRGIYKVPVYSSTILVEGVFLIPSAEAYPQNVRTRPEENRMILSIADMRGIREVSPLNWGGRMLDFGPGSGSTSLSSGIDVELGRLPVPGTQVPFTWSMEIGGGGSVSFAPLGRDAELSISGNWPSPSFQGASLPDDRTLDDEGFSAKWRIPEVSRPIRPMWDTSSQMDFNLTAHTLTVVLLEPIGTYARTERSVKYGALFLLIPFVVFFLFETLGGIRIHPVQYLLAGAADAVFYLLLLAVSEQIAFDWAYLTAAAAVTLLISLYSWSVSGGRAASLSMPVVLTGAYVWLWVTLQSEDYALLIGSVGLFVIVAAVMLLTRKVDWYRASSVPDNTDNGAEGQKGEPGQLDVLGGKRNADDGDGEQQGGEEVPEG
jgi:inner membrane protein